MLEQKTYTLPKRERLCAKTLIDQLFMGHSSVKKDWPVKVVYQVVKRKDAQDVPVEMLVSVSKRHFKRAVKRNHVKRQLRESYRLHKSVLFDALASHPDAKLMIAFIWMSGQIEDTEKVDGMMQRALDKVVKSLVFDEGDETIA